MITKDPGHKTLNR